MPLETRIFQGNVRTLLKEIGKDQELMFVGSKLMQRNFRTYCGLEYGTVEDGRSRRMTTHSLEN